jgi:hypothetical protein
MPQLLDTLLTISVKTFINLLISSGAVHPTKKVAMPDLKYALPELMINIEMFIFSILHLWAFAWKPYAIANANQGEVTDFFGNGKATYEGGRFGVGALVDAMNPLDLLKAIGRSARWLTVGRKHRMKDRSYQPHHESIGLEIPEPGVVNNKTTYGGAAAVAGGRTARYGGDEEGAILLANAQSNPETAHLGTSPYASDSDSYMHEHENTDRFYNHDNASSYDDLDHGNPYLAQHDAAHSYPADGPLREAVPMPMPDPYRPPPPYPDDHHS